MVRYTRLAAIVVFVLVALPGAALAQPSAPVQPVPALPPIPALPAAPAVPDLPVFDADLHKFKADMYVFKSDMDNFKIDLEDLKADLSFDLAFDFAQSPKPAGRPRPAPKVMIARGDNNEDRHYQNGTRALDSGRWDEAIEYFSRVVSQSGTRADGAMYWIAWATIGTSWPR